MVCFLSQLSTEKSYSSNLADVKCGVTQGSALGLLLFLIYKSDLHPTTKFFELHHFTDHTNPLNFNSCVELIKKTVYFFTLAWEFG